MNISDYIKLATLTPLQEQVVDRDICPKCHSKTLNVPYVCEGQEWCQCTKCLRVYVRHERRLTG